MSTKLNDSIHKLWNDYLELSESYSDEMPLYEFGFAMARFVAKMMFDTAPNDRVAFETIHQGVMEGWKWSNEEKEGE